MSTTIVFETHATTVDNESGLSTGWLPGELSPLGRQLAFGEALPVLHDWRLRECDYGELNGAAHALVSEVRPRYQHQPHPDGESWEQAIRRVAGFLTDLPSRWQGARVLVVGHLATRFAFEHVLHGVPLAQLLRGQGGWQAGWEYVLPTLALADTAP